MDYGLFYVKCCVNLCIKMAQSSVDSDRLSSAGISTHSSGTISGSVVGVRVGEQDHKKDENEYSLGPLPPMWEKAFTPSGEVYFIDHNTGTSHWLDPRLARVRKHSLGECGEDELPYGWERVTDERYGSYYVDHINRRTQYENPVLQARRLRGEKIASENGGSNQLNSPTPSGTELRGERFTVTLTKGTQGLGFTLIGAEGIPEAEGYLQIRSIVPHSPAWIDGALRPGDVLVGVGGRAVRGLAHAQVAQVFQSIAPGTDVLLHLVRGYPLTFDSDDPNTRVLSTLAVDAAAPGGADSVAMQQLTRALRSRFHLESPGRGEASPGHDEADGPEPPTPAHGAHAAHPAHAAQQRRLMSRSFDLDELPAGGERAAPPRCPSADHLLTLAAESGEGSGEAGQELVLMLRKGAAGFGFTIADNVHGQKVKKVLDRSRCAGLREGDLLLQIGDADVRHAPHQYVVQVLKECPTVQETAVRVRRRGPAAARAPRSRSASRAPQPHAAAAGNNSQLSRSKTPTAEQLRAPAQERLNGINGVEATYAVPLSKGRESLHERRRRSSTPGTLPLPALPQPQPQPQPAWARADPHPHQHQHQWQEPESWVDNSNNVRNWAESAQKWDENQKWDSANGQKWDGANGQKWEHANGQKWDEGPSNGNEWEGHGGGDRWSNGNGGHWEEVPTPTVRVDVGAAYWRGNASVADSSDNGGFPEDGMLHSPTTAAVSGLAAQHRLSPAAARVRRSPAHSTGPQRSHSPSAGSAGVGAGVGPGAGAHGRSHSPSDHSGSGRLNAPCDPMRVRESPSDYDRDGEPLTHHNSVYVANYPQVEAGGAADPEADVLVRLARSDAGFGFRIVGGTEDGSRIAVGYVVPGGPAEGLLRAGDLLTSVDGAPLGSLPHGAAVALVVRAAARGHVTLGVRHNRADVQQLGLPGLPPPQHQHQHQHQHQPLLAGEPAPAAVAAEAAGARYNILHPAPVYPPPHHHALTYGMQYEPPLGGGGGGAGGEGGGAWAAPYDVTVTRAEGEGFGFVVISSTNKATSTIGQLIPNSPAARCGVLRVGDTIVAINRTPIRNLPHPEVVALIKRSGTAVTLTVVPHDAAA